MDRRIFILDEVSIVVIFFFFQAEDGIRDKLVTGVQTCALPISDAASLQNLVVEIGRAYLSECGIQGPLDEPVQYVQFSEWQNEILTDESEEGERSEERRVGKECRSRWSTYP